MVHTPISHLEIDHFYQQNKEKLTTFRVYQMSTDKRTVYLRERLKATFGDRLKIDQNEDEDAFLINWSIDRVSQSIDREYDRNIKRKYRLYFGLGFSTCVVVFLSIIFFLRFIN